MEKEVEEYKKFRPGDPAMKTKAMLTSEHTHSHTHSHTLTPTHPPTHSPTHTLTHSVDTVYGGVIVQADTDVQSRV